MKEKFKKYLMLLMMAVGMLLPTAVPAFAYTGTAGQAAGTDAGTENGAAAEQAAAEETPGTENGQEKEQLPSRVVGGPFSVPGNGQLADDVSGDESKQFLTVQTKNGNTFFLVLDRSSNAENAYMLSLIDENDLAEFIGEEEKEPEQEQPSVVIPEKEEAPVSGEPETESGTLPEAEEKSGGMGAGALLAATLLLIGGGGFYYFKVIKPKQDEEESEGEDLEFYDGGAYINEDKEDSDGEDA